MKVGDPFFFIDHKWELFDIGIVKESSLDFALKDRPDIPGIVVEIGDEGELRQFNRLSPYYKRNEIVCYGSTGDGRYGYLINRVRHQIIERVFK